MEMPDMELTSLLVEHPDPISPETLGNLPLLSHRVTPQDWFDWPEWFAATGIPRPSRLRIVSFDSYPLVLQAAVTGQGVALGWKRTVSDMIADGKLRAACHKMFFSKGPNRGRQGLIWRRYGPINVHMGPRAIWCPYGPCPYGPTFRPYLPWTY